MPFLGREMGNEPDYSEEIAREIDEEIRRIIEEAHDMAHRVLREHIDELNKISLILMERETIDKDQFLRLLAGEDEEGVFPDEAREPAASEQPAGEPKRAPKPRPFPIPGATMQPPAEPEAT
jgi:cell division protease FtsH